VDPASHPAHVHRLAGVFLQVNPLDADPVGVAVHLDVEVSIHTQRFVVLADLVVLRHVRVVVVLAGEPAPRGDRAIQGKADLDRCLDGRLVSHRQRTRQT
jgi:hypothetical protein